MGDGWFVETLDKCRKFYRVYSSRQISSTMQTKLTAGVGFAKTKDGGTKRMSLFGIMVSQYYFHIVHLSYKSDNA